MEEARVESAREEENKDRMPDLSKAPHQMRGRTTRLSKLLQVEAPMRRLQSTGRVQRSLECI